MKASNERRIYTGYTVITTTHNPGHAIELGGFTLALYGGTYEFGKTESVITEETLNKVYGLSVELKKDKDRSYTVFTDRAENTN